MYIQVMYVHVYTHATYNVYMYVYILYTHVSFHVSLRTLNYVTVVPQDLAVKDLILEAYHKGQQVMSSYLYCMPSTAAVCRSYCMWCHLWLKSSRAVQRARYMYVYALYVYTYTMCIYMLQSHVHVYINILW